VSDSTPPARYDPLPDLSQMPAWIWRRLSRSGKAALGALAAAGLAAVLAFAPGIDRAKDERARTAAQERAQTRVERVAQMRVEQRPRFAAAAPAGADGAARERLLSDAAASVLADVRPRVDQPIRRVACEPFPRTVRRADPSARYGTYACLAVTHDVAATAHNEAATTGYPYRVRIDFESGRYGFCKVVGRAGEGMTALQPFVPLSPACGGM
jgi:hypothetical protein